MQGTTTLSFLNGKLNIVKFYHLVQLRDNLSDGASVNFWYPVEFSADLDVLAERDASKP